MHRSFLALAVIAAVVGVAAVFPACSNSGEGDRCDLKDDNSGNDDCQSGLSCVAGNSLPSKPQGDICCPSNLTYTDPICSRVGGLDAGPPPPDEDASTTDASDGATANDAANDTGSDAGGDTGSDTGASVDAGIDSSDSGNTGADGSADAPADG